MTAPNGPILFNSINGDDAAASGLGPATAQTGTGASITSASNVVTGITTTGVTAGDLLWVQSSTGRQFSIIASVDSGTQVTCDDNFDVTESGRTWAIGGKRATLAGSSELYDQSGSAGDAKAGHVLELENGYTETLSSTINLRVANSGTQGFTIRGALSASTKPVLTFTNNGTGIYAFGSYQLIQNLELKNSSVTKTSCIAVNVANYVVQTTLNLLDIHDVTDYWNHAFYCYSSGNTGATISRCSVGNCSGVGIYPRVCSDPVYVDRCKVFDCALGGLSNSTQYGSLIHVTHCLFYGNGSYGINVESGFASINGNIFHNNGADSIKIRNVKNYVSNNIISSTTNGINAGVTANVASNIFSSNSFYGCTNNTVNIEAAINSTTLTADPFVNAAGGDFNLNATNGGGAVLRSTSINLGS